MWGLFFALLGWTPVSLLLGALALYWGISSLRMKPERRAEGRAAAAAALSGGNPAPPPEQPYGPGTPQKPQRTAAVTGIVTAGIALALVAATFTAHVAYRDYYTCTQDALTTVSQDSCTNLLPQPMRAWMTQSG
jgi:hypothetical protein